MRRQTFHSPERDRANDDVLTGIIATVAPQPPTYLIRQITEHCWDVLKWDVFQQLYDYLYPAASHCRSWQEAFERMSADAQDRRPNPTFFEPLVLDGNDHPRWYFDSAGNDASMPKTGRGNPPHPSNLNRA